MELREPDKEELEGTDKSIISTTASINEEAIEFSEKMKNGANEYADHVLANIQLMITKMQNG